MFWWYPCALIDPYKDFQYLSMTFRYSMYQELNLSAKPVCMSFTAHQNLQLEFFPKCLRRCFSRFENVFGSQLVKHAVSPSPSWWYKPTKRYNLSVGNRNCNSWKFLRPKVGSKLTSHASLASPLAVLTTCGFRHGSTARCQGFVPGILNSTA